MLPDRVSNPGPLTYESGALPIAPRGPADPCMVCLSSKGSYQTLQMTGTHHFCLRQLVCTIVSLYVVVGQKNLLKQCRPKSDCAHRSVMIRVCTV